MKLYSPYSTPSSDPVTNIWHDALNNYAGSVTMNAMRGGVMKPYEVVGDAFGNALGNSIVEGMQQPSDNRYLLNTANQAADPGYYGASSSSDVGGLSRAQEERLQSGQTITDYGDEYADGDGALASSVGAQRRASGIKGSGGSRLDVTIGGAFKDDPRFMSDQDLLSAAQRLSSDLAHSDAMRTNDEYSVSEMTRLQARLNAASADPLTFESSTFTGSGLKAPSDGFWRGLAGEGRSVFEGPASFSENLGLTANGLVTGPVRAVYGLVSEIGNEYKDAYNLLTSDGTSYTPSSALGNSLQRQGVLGTVGDVSYALGSAPTKPVFDLLNGDYKAFGEGLPGMAVMGMGALRGIGSGFGLRSTTGLSFEDSLVLHGDASRAAIVQAIGDAAQPSIEALLKLDPNAQVGFRGSLAGGLKGEHKLGPNLERVGYDGDVAFKLGKPGPIEPGEVFLLDRTGPYRPYAGPQGYDADFFVVSDKLADRLGNRRWMDAARLDSSLGSLFDNFGATMRQNALLSGMKHSDGITFRVWSQDGIRLKTPVGDPQYYFLRGGPQ